MCLLFHVKNVKSHVYKWKFFIEKTHYGCQNIQNFMLISDLKENFIKRKSTKNRIHRLNLERLNLHRMTEPRKTQSWMDWTSNGPNPEWTQPRMDWTHNGLNLKWIELRMDRTRNGLNSEWTELRMDSSPNRLRWSSWNCSIRGWVPFGVKSILCMLNPSRC